MLYIRKKNVLTTVRQSRKAPPPTPIRFFLKFFHQLFMFSFDIPKNWEQPKIKTSIVEIPIVKTIQTLRD